MISEEYIPRTIMEYMQKSLSIIGYASGQGSGNSGASEGPHVFKQSDPFMRLRLQGSQIIWDKTFYPHGSIPDKFPRMYDICFRLALRTHELTIEKKRFVVLGGDHSSAIGTWSGVSAATRAEGAFGLIWVDAHMDSHTPENSRSGNIHGMPLATLLGYGYTRLSRVIHSHPKVLPEHVCLVGVRSFEPEEADLLRALNVRIFDMQEIHQRGLEAVLADALSIVQNNTVGFGVSVDLDAFDPSEAPGVTTPEENGLFVKEFCKLLASIADEPKFLGAEIAEFNPFRDKNHQTEAVIKDLLEALQWTH